MKKTNTSIRNRKNTRLEAADWLGFGCSIGAKSDGLRNGGAFALGEQVTVQVGERGNNGPSGQTDSSERQ